MPSPATADMSAQVPDRAGRAGLDVPVRAAPAAPPAGLQLRDPRLALQGLLPLQLPHRLSRLQVGTVVNIRVYLLLAYFAAKHKL